MQLNFLQKVIMQLLLSFLKVHIEIIIQFIAQLLLSKFNFSLFVFDHSMALLAMWIELLLGIQLIFKKFLSIKFLFINHS